MVLVVQNNQGYDVSIDKIEANQCTALGTGAVASVTSLLNGAKMSPPTTTMTCVISGTKYSGQVNITYTITDTGLQHKNVGQLQAKVE